MLQIRIKQIYYNLWLVQIKDNYIWFPQRLKRISIMISHTKKNYIVSKYGLMIIVNLKEKKKQKSLIILMIENNVNIYKIVKKIFNIQKNLSTFKFIIKYFLK